MHHHHRPRPRHRATTAPALAVALQACWPLLAVAVFGYVAAPALQVLLHRLAVALPLP